MKLRNKKTGEIKDFALRVANGDIYHYTLAELNEDWEDYEEPKESYYIDCDGEIYEPVRLNDTDLHNMTSIGNYFETREEAEQAVEKLKAWKRLKEAGFKFNNWIYDYREAEKENDRGLSIGASYNQLLKVDADDIDLLFGGEE